MWSRGNAAVINRATFSLYFHHPEKQIVLLIFFILLLTIFFFRLLLCVSAVYFQSIMAMLTERVFPCCFSGIFPVYRGHVNWACISMLFQRYISSLSWLCVRYLSLWQLWYLTSITESLICAICHHGYVLCIRHRRRKCCLHIGNLVGLQCDLYKMNFQGLFNLTPWGHIPVKLRPWTFQQD